jgi:iron(III) transport system ATP-binding protein
VLKVKNLSFKYNDSAPAVIKNINFELAKGEILCILGPSGSGKSTLLNCLAGFEEKSQGTIEIAGKIVQSESFFLPVEKRNIGFVFQDYALFPHLNVFDNIAFGLKTKNRDEKLSIVQRFLTLVGLTGYEKKHPNELSGGEQQRVALARALAPDPSVIFLDEPFSNIDPSLRTRLRLEVKNILKKMSVTAIFITHDKEEAFELADKIAILGNNQIMQTDYSRQLMTSPDNLFVINFLRAGILVPAKIINNKAITCFGEFKITFNKGSDSLYIPLKFVKVARVATEGINGKILAKFFHGDVFHYNIVGPDFEIQGFSSHQEFEQDEVVKISIDSDQHHPFSTF